MTAAKKAPELAPAPLSWVQLQLPLKEPRSRTSATRKPAACAAKETKRR